MAPRRSSGSAAPDALPALAVARQLESLQSLYTAWAELKAARGAAALARRSERDKLSTKASYLLNSVSAARAFAAPPIAALAPARAKVKGKKKKGVEKAPLPVAADPLHAFHAQAEAELQAATAALDERERAEEGRFAGQEHEIRRLIRERAEQHLRIHRPRLALAVHPVGPGRVIVQAQNLGEEDSVLLLRLLFDRLPTRWGFFADDQIDEVGTQSPRLYPDEGVSSLAPADADAGDQLLAAAPEFAPVRLHLPIRVRGRDFPRYRLIHRGPVAELEARRAGAPYQQVIAQEDSELLTGFLLSLKLRGAIELEIEVG